MRRLFALVVALFFLPAVGTGVLASAISRAPNRRAHEPGPSVIPAALAPYHVRELHVPVGPPTATLSAWILEPPDQREMHGTIVVLHGVRLNKQSMLPVGTALADAGYRALLVDLRGHGRSSGEYLTYGVVESHDVSELLDSLEAEGVALGPVGVHGFSYGAATAIELAANDPRVLAVVAVAPFASLRHVVRDYVHWQAPRLEPAVNERWLDATINLGGKIADFDPDAAAPVSAARRSHADLLLVHGASDEQVPAENSAEIADNALGRARLLLLPGETHASILADARGVVRAASVAWFDAHLPSRR